MEFLGVPPLAFALGMYLPIELNTPVLAGGLVAYFVEKSSKNDEVSKARKDRGILIASGFVAGGAIMGVVSAFLSLGESSGVIPRLNTGFGDTIAGEWTSIILFTALCIYMFWYAKRAAKE